MTKTETKIVDALEAKGRFHGFGDRACDAANKLVKKGLVERKNIRIISTYHPPVRANAKGHTTREITVYAK